MIALISVHFSATALADELKILPSSIDLYGKDAEQRLIVERYHGEFAVGHVTGPVEWSSSDESVVSVTDGRAIPGSNGSAVLTARCADGVASVAVTTRAMTDEGCWEFGRHVLPVISRAGCNRGACHGALAGKGGFRLSLRGYFPEGDYQTMTREARGRRIELSDPGRSLILAKPSGSVAHKGGLRLKEQSRDYRILSEWIAAGAIGPSAQDARLVDIEVHPPLTRITQGEQQQLLVTARYSDGRAEDVTGWATFSSTDQTVAQVDDDGLITVDGNGEGAIVVWFSSRIVLARVVSPYDNLTVSDNDAEFEPANLVDHHVLAKLRQLGLKPSPGCEDTEYVRRAYLDVVGRLPTPKEVTEFLESRRPDKRRLLVDRLLASDDYVDYFAYQLSDLLLVNGRRLRPEAVAAYYHWIRRHVADNTPWDAFVREILTAKGSSIENGATNFFALHQDPESMSENVCQAFLGLSIGCAKCHNHPLEKWSNDEYYAMANFFSRVKAKGWGGDAREGDGRRVLFVDDQGDLIQPLTGRPQPPTPLGGDPIAPDFQGDRRDVLADWLVSEENPYFTRAIANRVWASLLGRGIVDPVDDMRISNPASNEALLDALSDYLIKVDYDLRSLSRLILNSETYQRSSRPLPENREDDRYFSRYYPKRLKAEVLLDAISQVTEVPSRFDEVGFFSKDVQSTAEYPIGTRALELYDSAVTSKFLETFGRNDRDITCECERSNTPNIVQVLHISNGTTINSRLKDANSCVAHALAEPFDWESIIHNAFLQTLSRPPSAIESTQLIAEFDASKDVDRRLLVEDLYWSLMSCREFLFNH